MKTQITAAGLTNSLNAATNEVRPQGSFYTVLLIAIILAITLIILLLRGSREQADKFPVKDFVRDFLEKNPERSEKAASFLKFNNCLYQSTEYSEYDVTVKNPEIEIADGRTLHFKQLENRERYFIGRGSANNDIEIINNIGISREHAVLEKVPGKGYRIRLCAGTDNSIYLCNEHFQNPKEITEHIFQGETVYLILGDIRYGEKIVIRDTGHKWAAAYKTVDSKVRNDATRVGSAGRERWQV